MKQLKTYRIEFKSLKIAAHVFDFEVDSTFFEHFDNDDIKGGNLRVQIILDKHANFLQLNFDIKGDIYVSCDRCLDDLAIKVNTKEILFVGFGETTYEESAEKIILAESEDYIDVAQFIYEFTTLCIPIRKVHPKNKRGDSTCNKAMLSKLSQYTQIESTEETDPRWDTLKELLD